MRLFIAIDLPEVLIKKIKILQDEIKRGCRARVSWSIPENIHLTLKFLGEVQEGKIDDIKEKIEDAGKGVGPFLLSVNGIGYFPNPHRPRVIWVGIKTYDNMLNTLYERLESGLKELGFEKEDRRFHPHLTLGRIKEITRKTALKGMPDNLNGSDELGKFKAEGICLYKSELNPKGAVYTKLFECKLTA